MAGDARDYRNTGAFNVNEQYATSVRYALAIERGEVRQIGLRFMNGRSELAAVQLAPSAARDVLGEANYAAALRTLADAQAPGRDEPTRTLKGELRGKNLEFRQVLLPGYALAQDENAIFMDSRSRQTDAPAKAAGEGGPLPSTAAKANQVPAAAATTAHAASVLAATAATVASFSDLDAGKTPALDAEEQARQQRLRANAVPDAVAERFLKVDDKFYFPDKKLAFVDRGSKLKAETNNLEVVRSIVTIAETRGWEALTVTGAKDFRKEVWREASLRGIDVRGYQPSDLERQELQRAFEKHNGPNEIQREFRQQVPVPSSRDAAQPSIVPLSTVGARAANNTAPGVQQSRMLLTGRLIESGAAAYKFDPKENPSYFVKIQTEKGERMLWGIDLERALLESRTGVKPGDQVSIENQGAKPVTVTASVRNDAGQVVGDKTISTHRNTWVIEKPAYFDERAEKAAAFRNGELAKQELILQYPELINAIATMRLGELFAEKRIERPEDRRRVENALRDRLANAVDRDETIQAPKIKEVTVRKLTKISGELDEVAQRAAAEKAIKGAREVGARAKEAMQHVRA